MLVALQPPAEAFHPMGDLEKYQNPVTDVMLCKDQGNHVIKKNAAVIIAIATINTDNPNGIWL